jgi:rfaE bifunctional protein kinase chain/domain
MKAREPDRGKLKRIVNRFSGKRVLVVGDLMLDEYVYGRTDRISREAPVLILAFSGSMLMPGGAGNACANIDSLGGVAVPVGVVGEDGPGEKLLGLLRDAGISTESVVCSAGFESIQKTRILAGDLHCAKQQVIRVDRGKRGSVRKKTEQLLIEKAAALIPTVDAVLFSDYGYGTVSNRLRSKVMELARSEKKIVCADSRFELAKFRGATVATPNETEAGPAVGTEIRDRGGLLSAGKKLLKRLGLRSLIITQGSSGMTVFEREKSPVHIPIFGSDEIADVTGAGDTVAGAVTLSMCSGANAVEASCIATYASSVVVMKRGTAVLSPGELLEAVSRGRIGPLNSLR